MGAGQATLDLRGLKVSSVVVEAGMGQAIVTLPASGAVQARVNRGHGRGGHSRAPRDRLPRQCQGGAGHEPRCRPARTALAFFAYLAGIRGAQDRIEVDASCAMGSVVVQEY